MPISSDERGYRADRTDLRTSINRLPVSPPYRAKIARICRLLLGVQRYTLPIELGMDVILAPRHS
jgi:hypothetical protein